MLHYILGAQKQKKIKTIPHWTGHHLFKRQNLKPKMKPTRVHTPSPTHNCGHLIHLVPHPEPHCCSSPTWNCQANLSYDGRQQSWAAGTIRRHLFDDMLQRRFMADSALPCQPAAIKEEKKERERKKGERTTPCMSVSLFRNASIKIIGINISTMYYAPSKARLQITMYDFLSFSIKTAPFSCNIYSKIVTHLILQ